MGDIPALLFSGRVPEHMGACPFHNCNSLMGADCNTMHARLFAESNIIIALGVCKLSGVFNCWNFTRKRASSECTLADKLSWNHVGVIKIKWLSCGRKDLQGQLKVPLSPPQPMCLRRSRVLTAIRGGRKCLAQKLPLWNLHDRHILMEQAVVSLSRVLLRCSSHT